MENGGQMSPKKTVKKPRSVTVVSPPKKHVKSKRVPPPSDSDSDSESSASSASSVSESSDSEEEVPVKAGKKKTIKTKEPVVAAPTAPLPSPDHELRTIMANSSYTREIAETLKEIVKGMNAITEQLSAIRAEPVQQTHTPEPKYQSEIEEDNQELDLVVGEVIKMD
jgi:hypothetical protein